MHTHSLDSRLRALEAAQREKVGGGDPWASESFLLRVYLFDGADDRKDVPRHPDGRPITLDDVRRHFEGSADVPDLAAHFLKAEPIGELR